MREENLLRGILETFRNSEVAASRFLHYARLGVLVTEKTEIEAAERMLKATADDSPDEALDPEVRNDRLAARGWGETGLSTDTEGAYLLAQLRRQLRHSVCDLYAFGDLIDITETGAATPPLVRLEYTSDQEPSAWPERLSDATETANESNTETFPREEGGFLVVPKP